MATFSNQAVLTYNGNTATSNIVTGEITDILSVTKTALSTCYYRDDCGIAFVVTLNNSGSAAITNVTVSDNLGAYTFGEQTLTPLDYELESVRFFVNGIASSAPAVNQDNGVVFSGITLPADSTAMLIYKANANEYAPLTTGSAIENTVTVKGDGIVTPVSASSTVDVCDSVRLEITKSLSPTVVNDNSRITYTLNVFNYSNSEADVTDNVTVTDIFDPILSNITVTYDGTIWAEGTNYTYNTSTGEFSTIAGQITIPAATITQDSTTGVVTLTPAVSTIVITGTI